MQSIVINSEIFELKPYMKLFNQNIRSTSSSVKRLLIFYNFIYFVIFLFVPKFPIHLHNALILNPSTTPVFAISMQALTN